MLLTDLTELKSVLGINPANKREDQALYFWIRQACGLIGDFLGRPDLFLKERTEYYNGTNTQKIHLATYPSLSVPTPRCWVDEDGAFGQASGSFESNTELTYGTHFTLWIDSAHPTTGVAQSRRGILIRLRDVWPRPAVRVRGMLSPFPGPGFGVVKVTHTAGYTLDDLPEGFRVAANILVARLRTFFPTGMEVTSESYEERSVSVSVEQKNYLMAQVKPHVWHYRNWKH